MSSDAEIKTDPTYEDFSKHIGHKITLVGYCEPSPMLKQYAVVIVCEECNEELIIARNEREFIFQGSMARLKTAAEVANGS